MTNSSGYLKKILSISSFFIFFSVLTLFANVGNVGAAGLDTDLRVLYTLNEEGDLNSQLRFTLSNSTIIPTVLNYYTATLPYSSLNDVVVRYGGEKLDHSIHKQSVGTDVVVNFGDTVVPTDGEVIFTVEFNNEEYLDSKGPSSITLPSDFVDTESLSMVVSYPTSWGQLGWVSAGDYKLSQNGDNNIVTISNIGSQTLNLLLGENVLYQFEISRNLVNADTNSVIFDVSVPLWSSNQKVFFTDIDPLPTAVLQDQDGNITFNYLLDADSSIKAKVKGYISLAKTTEALTQEQISSAVRTDGYWKIEGESEYKRAALYLQGKGLNISSERGSFGELKTASDKEQFLKNIYTYVLNRLSSTEITSTSTENPLRAGATLAIEKKNLAVPEDYSDVLIALLRHFGVPSRMVTGYVAQESGFKTDGFFHSWVEYWDTESGAWVILDPALDDINEINLYEYDFRDRVTLLIRSSNSISPKLSYFLDEEFILKPSSIQLDENLSSSAVLKTKNARLASKYINAEIVIENNGNTPFLVEDIKLLVGEERIVYSSIYNYKDQLVVPGMSLEIPITIEGDRALSELGSDLTIQYTISSPDQESEVQVSPLAITIDKYWWWDWMIRLISSIIFLGIVASGYKMLNLVRKLWK